MASLDPCPPIRPCRAPWINTQHPPPSTVTPPMAQKAPLLATLPTRLASTHILLLHPNPQTHGPPPRHTPTQTGLMSPPAPPLWGTPSTHCHHHTTNTFPSRRRCSRHRNRCSSLLNSLSLETCRCLRKPAKGKQNQTDFGVLCCYITRSNAITAFPTSLLNSLFFIIKISRFPFYIFFFSLHLRKLYSFFHLIEYDLPEIKRTTNIKLAVGGSKTFSYPSQASSALCWLSQDFFYPFFGIILAE